MDEHRLDAAAVLAEQTIHPRQTGLDLLESLGIGLQRVEPAAQVRAQIRELETGGRQAGAQRVELGVDRGGTIERCLGLGQQPRRALAILRPRQRRRRRRDSLAKALDPTQPVALGDQRRLLVGIGGDLLDLGELEAEQIEVAISCTLTLAQRLQLTVHAAWTS